MHIVPLLPLAKNLQTPEVLHRLVGARSALAEFKGTAGSIPNQQILIDTLGLQEAKDSSEIENIVTTQDELFTSSPSSGLFASAASKEVYQYAFALKKGFDMVKAHGLLTNNYILEVQAVIDQNRAGYRKLPGTKLINDKTNEIVYTPPQDYDTIVKLMENLQAFMNDDRIYKADPLVKMAIIHHQFETIHPFYDGNGRTGRIINLLYLIQKGLLHLPILYLSRYIIKHKATYYKLLQQVRETGEWEEWILFMLDGIEETATQGVATINGIKNLMQEYKQRIRTELPKIYSQDLLNNFFRHPYTKIDIVKNDLGVSRLTATKYLDQIVSIGLLKKQKVGRDNYYINPALVVLLSGNAKKKK